MLLPTRCPACQRPGPSPCLRCITGLVPPRFSPVPTLFAFEGTGRQLLLALKYRNGRSALAWLGSALARIVDPGAIDAVTWAPTHAVRRRHRGYDQAELLARAAARALRVPCRSLLRRTDRAGPQTGRDRDGRLGAPAFVVVTGVPPRLVVVDDVVTTGATLRAAVAALERAGAPHVQAIAAAATPLARRRSTPPMLEVLGGREPAWRSG